MSKADKVIRFPHAAKEQIEEATAAAMFIEDRADALWETAMLRDNYIEKIRAIADQRLEQSRDHLEWVAWEKVLRFLDRAGRPEERIADLAAEVGEEGKLIQHRLKRARRGE